MSAPLALGELLIQVQDIYRPSLRGHWQRRTVNRVRRWLGRPDAELFWDEEQEAAGGPDRLVLPGRERSPRWLFFSSPLNPPAASLASVLVGHLATVATLMELDSAQELPLRWRSMLTPRQVQVAALAADGASNEEIAAELGIAPRTVARLLQETFLRLDCTNRQALAAEWVLGRPPTPFVDTAAGLGLTVQAPEPEEP